MDQIHGLLKKNGPLVGKELIEKTGLDVFDAWKACQKSGRVTARTIGNPYLRLDQKIENYARLSPSIMREFLNYTVIGLHKDELLITGRAEELADHITYISRKKFDLARDSICRVLNEHPDKESIFMHSVFILAGDVIYNMAHSEPRPEVSTGELVKGSDLDVIAVTDDLPEEEIYKLDQLIYREKYNLLFNPAQKEELDYVVKDLDTVKRQLQFEGFKDMVASKILYEGIYLCGSYDLYLVIKEMLEEYGVSEKLKLLEEKAHSDRVEAEEVLLLAPGSVKRDELLLLFYTTEEKEEIF